MSDDIHIRTSEELQAVVAALARERRMVFIAGLPGVGKSLFIRELARAAQALGRTVHLLQWDVARPAAETAAVLARHPEVAGVTHPVIRKAVGLWARNAVVQWSRAHPGSHHLLIGETPLVGNRLLELAQARTDEAEALLAQPDAHFVVPVPSSAVRAAIEAARARTYANPAHAREAADAPPNVLRLLWQEVHAVAVRLGAAQVAGADAPYDPQAYAAVYRHLLRHRHASMLWVDALIPSEESVYNVGAAAELAPSAAEAEALIHQIEQDGDIASIERAVASWFEQI